MKKISILLTAVILTTMVLSTFVSANTIPTGPDGVVWYDPVTYETPLSLVPSTNTYILGLNYMRYDWKPDNLIYVSTEETPVGKGFLRHAYNAEDSKVNNMFQLNVGDMQSTCFTSEKKSYMPGSIGKQKAEVVFRLTSVEGITMNTNSPGDVFDFRVWRADKAGDTKKVMGVSVNQTGQNNLGWNTTLGWNATLNKDETSNRGIRDTEGALYTNTWYRATIVTDFATSYQQGYIEKWDDSTKSWINLKSLFTINGDYTDRTLEGMKIFAVSSSARIRFSNKLGYDIAQARIVRDNIMVYQSNPANATTAAEKIALKDKYGVDVKLDDNNNIVATAYVAGNAFGKDEAGNPTKWYTYSDGTYEPRSLKPVLIVAQYDENGVLIEAELKDVELSTLKSGYRANGKNFADYTYEGEETADGAETSYLQKSLDYKKLEVVVPKDVQTKTAKVFLMTGFDNIIPMSATVDCEY